MTIRRLQESLGRELEARQRTPNHPTISKATLRESLPGKPTTASKCKAPNSMVFGRCLPPRTDRPKPSRWSRVKDAIKRAKAFG